jgi:hypothetical protein
MSNSSNLPEQGPGKPEIRVGEMSIITDGEVRVFFENFPAIIAGIRKPRPGGWQDPGILLSMEGGEERCLIDPPRPNNSSPEKAPEDQ